MAANAQFQVNDKSENDTEAMTFDGGKAPLALIPSFSLCQVALVLNEGAKKYDLHNWRKGMSYLRTASCALRHIFAFLRGENLDPESGLSHIAHAITRLMFLLEYTNDAFCRGTYDDRLENDTANNKIQNPPIWNPPIWNPPIWNPPIWNPPAICNSDSIGNATKFCNDPMSRYGGLDADMCGVREPNASKGL